MRKRSYYHAGISFVMLDCKINYWQLQMQLNISNLAGFKVIQPVINGYILLNCTDSSKLGCSVSSVILCHLRNSGNIPCFPKQSSFKGNLITVEEASVRECAQRAKPKLKLYEALVNLLSSRGQWVLDPIGGTGRLINHS